MRLPGTFRDFFRDHAGAVVSPGDEPCYDRGPRVAIVSILPDERPTHNNALALPTHVEAMVVAPDRRLAQPAVSFLRQEAIDVQLTTDVDSAFEEALMHPPDVIVVDGR